MSTIDIIKVSGSVYFLKSIEEYAKLRWYQLFLLPYSVDITDKRINPLLQKLELAQIDICDLVLVWNQEQTFTKNMKFQIAYAEYLKKPIIYKEALQ